MTQHIILSIVSLSMVLLCFQQQNIFGKVITVGLTVGVLLAWFPSHNFITIGFYTYLVFSCLGVVYGLTQKQLSKKEKALISITALMITLINIFAAMNWPYVNEVKLLLVIPVIGNALELLITRGKYQKENSLVTILSVDSLLKLINMIV